MNRTTVKIIYLKELLDTLRDKRTLGVMILLPALLYPLLLIGGGNLLIWQVEKTRKKVSRIALADADSPALHAVLDADERLEVVGVANARTALRRGSVDAVVAVPPGCDQALASGQGVQVTLLYDGTREDSLRARSRVLEALNAFEEVILEHRWAQQGLDTSFAHPLQTSPENIASAQQRGDFLLGPMLPFILTIVALLGAFYPAIDLTAGEKERGTLETLLTTPVRRREIVVGKYLTVCTISWATVLLHLGSLALTATYGLARCGLQEKLEFTLPFPVIAVTLLLMFPMTLFFSAGMMAMALFARSFKEAQSYLSPLYTVAVLPTAVVFLPGVQLNWGLALVPVAGPALFIKQFVGGPPDWSLGGIVLLVTGLYTALALGGAIRLFAREDVVLTETDLLSWRYLRARLRRGEPEGPQAGEVLVLFAGVLLGLYYIGSWLQRKDLGVGLILTQLFLILAPGLLFLVVRRYNLGATLRLRRPDGGTLLAAVCAAVGGALLTVELAALENLIFPPPEGFRSQTERLWEQLTGYGFPVALLVGAVLVAVCEETLFRGVILAGLQRSWGPKVGIILTSLLFGISHLTPYQIVTTVWLGLLLGYLVWRSGSLWCSIIASTSVNGLTLGLAFGPLSWPSWGRGMAHLPPSLLAAGVLLCFGGLVMLHFLSPKPDLPLEEEDE